MRQHSPLSRATTVKNTTRNARTRSACSTNSASCTSPSRASSWRRRSRAPSRAGLLRVVGEAGREVYTAKNRAPLAFSAVSSDDTKAASSLTVLSGMHTSTTCVALSGWNSRSCSICTTPFTPPCTRPTSSCASSRAQSPAYNNLGASTAAVRAGATSWDRRVGDASSVTTCCKLIHHVAALLTSSSAAVISGELGDVCICLPRSTTTTWGGLV
mmetsp:Transcript_6471/g.12273  ORF Transcript_6471/g.12273 Transcript_6471/m.12273 type:complete len:214 (-) Transcript_6471:309-950(-)